MSIRQSDVSALLNGLDKKAIGFNDVISFIDDFYHLPYSSVALGEMIAKKEAGELFIQIEKSGRTLNLEETIEWIKQHG